MKKVAVALAVALGAAAAQAQTPAPPPQKDMVVRLSPQLVNWTFQFMRTLQAAPMLCDSQCAVTASLVSAALAAAKPVEDEKKEGEPGK